MVVGDEIVGFVWKELERPLLVWEWSSAHLLSHF